MIRTHEKSITWPAAILSLLVHGLLIIGMVFSINWKVTPPPAVMQATLWESLPNPVTEPAPAQEVIEPTPPQEVVPEEPQSETPPLEQPIEAKPTEAPKPIAAKAPEPPQKNKEIEQAKQDDIALKLEKKHEQQKKQEALKKLELEKKMAEAKKIEAQKDKAAEDKKIAEKKLEEQKKLETQKIEAAKKEAEKKLKAEEAKKALIAQMREEELSKSEAKKQAALKALQSEIATDAKGSAESKVDQSQLSAYIEKLKAKIRGNVNQSLCPNGNPELIFNMRLLPTGEIAGTPKLIKSSEDNACDEAVTRAILASEPFALPDDKATRDKMLNIKLKFKPKD